MKEYYDKRAPEYDDWYLGRGLFEPRDRAGWDAELDQLFEVIAALGSGRTLDVACGTGFLTRHLRGDVVGLDQSKGMLNEAHKQAPSVTYVQGDGLALPFVDHSFDRVFTGHFYGHLEPPEREPGAGDLDDVERHRAVVADLEPRPARHRDRARSP